MLRFIFETNYALYTEYCTISIQIDHENYSKSFQGSEELKFMFTYKSTVNYPICHTLINKCSTIFYHCITHYNRARKSLFILRDVTRFTPLIARLVQ